MRGMYQVCQLIVAWNSCELRRCQRVKHKCDRKVCLFRNSFPGGEAHMLFQIPCSQCVRRGCEDVCPTSELLQRVHDSCTDTGAGAKNERNKEPSPPIRLHGASLMQRKAEKLAELSHRIGVLEDALLAEGCSDHPLMSNKLSVVSKRHAQNVDVPDRPHDKAGTLAISELSGTTYLGASAIEVRRDPAHARL